MTILEVSKTSSSPALDKFYDHVYDWIIRFGPRFIIGLVVLFIGLWLVNRLLVWWHSGLHKKHVDPSLKPFLVSLVGVILRVLLILAVMQIMGIGMTLFATVIGALGVAAGLALSGTLQNFASGVLILLLKPFTVGDSIVSQGFEGIVSSIQIFYTIVTTFDNRDVIIPNGKLSNDIIVNVSRQGNRRLDIDLKFANNIDLQQIKNIINQTIDKEETILAKPQRRIGVSLLDPDGYHLMVNVWVKAHTYQDTKMALQENLIENIKKAGIKVPGM